MKHAYLFLACALTVCGLGPLTQAASIRWDADISTTGVQEGTGTWDMAGTSTNWWNDTYGTKHYSISLNDDSIKLLKTKQIPDATWAEISKLREDIIAGKITVEPIFDATKVRALMTDVSAPAQ